METIPLAYYALVCGALSLLSPSFGGLALRGAIGAIVGVCAAIAFPTIVGLMN